MFKKKLLIMFVLLSLAAFTGCSNEKTNNNNGQENDNNNIVQEENITLSNLEQKINDLGIETTKTKTAYEMVGAKDGYKLTSNNSTLEVYQFDTSTDAYKTAEETQKITLESMGISFDAVVKNGFAYILNNNFPEYDAVLNLLNKLQ